MNIDPKNLKKVNMKTLAALSKEIGIPNSSKVKVEALVNAFLDRVEALDAEGTTIGEEALEMNNFLIKEVIGTEEEKEEKKSEPEKKAKKGKAKEPKPKKEPEKKAEKEKKPKKEKEPKGQPSKKTRFVCEAILEMKKGKPISRKEIVTKVTELSRKKEFPLSTKRIERLVSYATDVLIVLGRAKADNGNVTFL